MSYRNDNETGRPVEIKDESITLVKNVFMSTEIWSFSIVGLSGSVYSCLVMLANLLNCFSHRYWLLFSG